MVGQISSIVRAGVNPSFDLRNAQINCPLVVYVGSTEEAKELLQPRLEKKGCTDEVETNKVERQTAGTNMGQRPLLVTEAARAGPNRVR